MKLLKLYEQFDLEFRQAQGHAGNNDNLALLRPRSPAPLLAFIIALTLLTASPVHADDSAPPFLSPYNSSEPLEKFLVFSAPPRANVPDGQVHWVDLEVPGIDVLGPDGDIRNMCPDEGLAWSLEGGDPFGGGSFVAVECQGQAEGWQMLAFHLCEVRIGFSIDNAHRLYTRVPSGSVVGRECGHTHLSLGYWAREGAKKSLPCPQWHVQERYWVNPACLAQATGLPLNANAYWFGAEDWEMRYLTPQVLNPLRQGALAVVMMGLALYVFQAFWRPARPEDFNKKTGPAFEATLKSGIWFWFLIFLVVLSTGPVWPVNGVHWSGYTADDRQYRALAQQVNYSDWRLLEAFYAVAVPRDAAGLPAKDGQPGKVFPPEAAAAIPFGETNADEWQAVDPTQPGPHGQYRAWEAVAERWPASWYERNVLGLSVSREAQRQREGLQAVARNPALLSLGRQLGRTIRAEDLYGSSAGALGRTQILPGHFAPGGLCGDLASMDVWNDPLAVAECTTRYLTVNGCWGSWWANGDVWSALCSYNPGAWNRGADQWYWNVLQDRMTHLTAASAALDLKSASPEALAGRLSRETHVSTPVFGLLLTQALLDGGQSAYRLPDPLAGWAAQIAPQLSSQRASIRVLYRLFRAWILVYYPPETLLALGVQL